MAALQQRRQADVGLLTVVKVPPAARLQSPRHLGRFPDLAAMPRDAKDSKPALNGEGTAWPASAFSGVRGQSGRPRLAPCYAHPPSSAARPRDAAPRLGMFAKPPCLVDGSSALALLDLLVSATKLLCGLASRLRSKAHFTVGVRPLAAGTAGTALVDGTCAGGAMRNGPTVMGLRVPHQVGGGALERFASCGPTAQQRHVPPSWPGQDRCACPLSR